MGKQLQDDVELVEEVKEELGDDHQELEVQQESSKPKGKKKNKKEDKSEKKEETKVKVQFQYVAYFNRRYEARTTYEFTKEEFKKLQTTSFKYRVV